MLICGDRFAGGSIWLQVCEYMLAGDYICWQLYVYNKRYVYMVIGVYMIAGVCIW